MRHIEVELASGFHVMAGTARSQAATMVIEPNATEGGPDNRHHGADQWLYVVSGSGEATVGNQTVQLQPGSLLLIEAGEAHEIRAAAAAPLRTLNFYAPPEY